MLPTPRTLTTCCCYLLLPADVATCRCCYLPLQRTLHKASNWSDCVRPNSSSSLSTSTSHFTASPFHHVVIGPCVCATFKATQETTEIYSWKTFSNNLQKKTEIQQIIRHSTIFIKKKKRALQPRSHSEGVKGVNTERFLCVDHLCHVISV